MKKFAAIFTSIALLAGTSAYADAIVTNGQKYIDHNEFKGHITNVSKGLNEAGNKTIHVVIQSANRPWIEVDFSGDDLEDGRSMFSLLGQEIIVYTAQNNNIIVVKGFQAHTVDG